MPFAFAPLQPGLLWACQVAKFTQLRCIQLEPVLVVWTVALAQMSFSPRCIFRLKNLLELCLEDPFAAEAVNLAGMLDAQEGEPVTIANIAEKANITSGRDQFGQGLVLFGV